MAFYPTVTGGFYIPTWMEDLITCKAYTELLRASLCDNLDKTDHGEDAQLFSLKGRTLSAIEADTSLFVKVVFSDAGLYWLTPPHFATNEMTRSFEHDPVAPNEATDSFSTQKLQLFLHELEIATDKPSDYSAGSDAAPWLRWPDSWAMIVAGPYNTSSRFRWPRVNRIGSKSHVALRAVLNFRCLARLAYLMRLSELGDAVQASAEVLYERAALVFSGKPDDIHLELKPSKIR